MSKRNDLVQHFLQEFELEMLVSTLAGPELVATVAGGILGAFTITSAIVFPVLVVGVLLASDESVEELHASEADLDLMLKPTGIVLAALSIMAGTGLSPPSDPLLAAKVAQLPIDLGMNWVGKRLPDLEASVEVAEGAETAGRNAYALYQYLVRGSEPATKGTRTNNSNEKDHFRQHSEFVSPNRGGSANFGTTEGRLTGGGGLSGMLRSTSPTEHLKLLSEEDYDRIHSKTIEERESPVSIETSTFHRTLIGAVAPGRANLDRSSSSQERSLRDFQFRDVPADKIRDLPDTRSLRS